MNSELHNLVAKIQLSDDAHRAMRYAFGLACAERVRQMLEDDRAIQLLDILKGYVEGRVDETALAAAATDAAHLANHHRGSNSIDGSKHSAVSATYAVANALAGRALDAADYAAYSTVYGYGSYAVNDPESFAPEYAWQVETFTQLLSAEAAQHSVA